MFRNHLLIALRHIVRNKLHSFINIFGLAIGMTASLFVFLYIEDELSFDTMHPAWERTYRLGVDYRAGENTRKWYVAPGNWLTRLKENLPEVEHVLRVMRVSYPTSIANKEDDRLILSDDVRWVEQNFHNVIDLDLIAGDPANPLPSANAMLLSESQAKVLFADINPIGRFVVVNDNSATQGRDVEMVVTGVYKDYPLNSTFRHKILFNVESLRPFQDPGTDLRNDRFYQLYVVLRNSDALPKMIDYLESVCREMEQASVNQQQAKIFPIVRKITDLHFDQEVIWDFKGGSADRVYLKIFSGVAFLILLVSCINYINLTTARAVNRGKEISIRKTFGSRRIVLIRQFLLESFVISVISVAVCIGLIIIFLGRFNAMTSKNFTWPDLFHPEFFMLAGGVCLIVTVLGGSYPALFLSGLKPIELLKGKLTSGRGADLIRKSMVTGQFFVSLTLIIFTFAVIQQMELMYHSKLNEHGDQLMALRWGSNVSHSKYPAFKNTLLQDPEIAHVTMGNHLPRLDHFGGIQRLFKVPDVSENELPWNLFNVDFDFPKCFNLEFIAGRDFDPSNTADSSNFIINASAAKSLGKEPHEIVGETIQSLTEGMTGKIIGVVRDFPYKSAKYVIEPLVLSPSPQHFHSIVFVKLPSGNIGEKKEFVEQTWREVIADVGIETWFVSDIFDRQYKAERIIAGLVKNFNVLIILLTLFGLLGLASYLAEKKRKEIGIRKVIGATSFQIYRLFMMDFIRIQLVACLIALPVSYYVLTAWLNNFALKTPLSFALFAGSIGLIFLIVVLTVSSEIIRAAKTSPAKIIQHE